MATATKATTAFKVHPVAAIFPMLGQVELTDLANDISAHGLREPIVVHDGAVLDGRNRLAACKLADVEPEFREWKPGHETDTPDAWIISVNLKRRHLDESQRQMAASDYADYLRKCRSEKAQAADSEGDDSSANLQTGEIAALAAAAFNTSKRGVYSADKVKAEGAPELVAAVRAGRAKVSSAVKATRAPKAEQAKAARAGKAAVTNLGKKVEAEQPSPPEKLDPADAKRAGQATKEWKAILVLAGKLDVALGKAGIVRDKGVLCDQEHADQMARWAKPIVKGGAVLGATCQRVADAMEIVAIAQVKAAR